MANDLLAEKVSRLLEKLIGGVHMWEARVNIKTESYESPQLLDDIEYYKARFFPN